MVYMWHIYCGKFVVGTHMGIGYEINVTNFCFGTDICHDKESIHRVQ